MSLFLVQDLNAQPIYIGLYTVSVTLSGLAISQWLGQKADAGLSARKMYIFAVLAMAIGLAIYANVSSFWLVLLAGIAFVAVGNAAIPQMLTISRQWANQTDKVDVGQFNANLRAAISFAWIAGPAIGFALASAFGFLHHFIWRLFVLLLQLFLRTNLFLISLNPIKLIKLKNLRPQGWLFGYLVFQSL